MWPILILAVFYLASRLVNLTLLPVFADEAIYIHWSQVIWHDANNRFIPLSDGKPPLFMWLLVPLLKIFSDPLFAGRSLSVISGLMTLIGVYLITRKFFSHRIAILAVILLILQPFLFFYDRLAVVDSMLTAFGVWAFYFAILLFEKPNLGRGIILGTVWGGAMLTKPTGVYYPFLSAFFLFLFPLKEWWQKVKKMIIPGLMAGIYGLGFYNILRLSGAFYMINARSADYLRSREELLTNPLQFIPGTSQVMFQWFLSYFTFIGVVLLLLGFVLAFFKKERKIGLLFVWILSPFLVQAAIGKIVYPRYLLIVVPFCLIVSSWTIWQIASLKKIITYRIAVWAVVGLMLVSWASFVRLLIINPVSAPLHPRESEQYLYEWSAGYGIKEVAVYLKDLPKPKPIVVATEGYFGTLPNGLQIFLNGVENIEIYGVGQPIHYLPDEILEALAEGKETYLVVNDTRLKIEDQSRLQLVAEYPKPKGPKGQERLLFFKVL